MNWLPNMQSLKKTGNYLRVVFIPKVSARTAIQAKETLLKQLSLGYSAF